MQCGPDRQPSADVGIGMAQVGTFPDKCGLGLELARWNYPGRIRTTFADMSVAVWDRPCPRHTRLYSVVLEYSAGKPWINVAARVFDRCRRLYFEVESVPAVATFFSSIATRINSFHAWEGGPMEEFPNIQEYAERWNDVDIRVLQAARCFRFGDSDISLE